MHYCPNCSAYLGEGPTPNTCHKCGYDIMNYRRQQAQKHAAAGAKTGPNLDTLYGQAIDQAGEEVQTGRACPQCGTNMMPLRGNEFEFKLLGKNVPVAGVKFGQMRIMKRVVTAIIVEFDAWVCQNDHQYFSKFNECVRFLCPVCKEHTVPFGSMIRTCRRCNYNYQSSDFATAHGRELMEEEGWQYAPQLEDEPV